MNDLSHQTLAQIVNSNHRAATVFEKYKLDFCCRGKRSLKEACAEKALVVKDVLADLQNIQDAGGDNCKVTLAFDKLPLTVLANYILNTHHEYVKKEMPQIFMYLQKVTSKHGDKHPELYRIFEAFSAVKEEMELHLQKEELVLFPRIKELEKFQGETTENKLNISYLLSPIHLMEQEHEHAGTLMEEISELSHNYTAPADACTTYRLSFAALQAFETDLHQHVHLENNILFPRSIELFRQVNATALN